VGSGEVVDEDLRSVLTRGNREIDNVDNNFRDCRLSGSYQNGIKPSVGFKSSGLLIFTAVS
jgi:hypothetical protein